MSCLVWLAKFGHSLLEVDECFVQCLFYKWGNPSGVTFSAWVVDNVIVRVEMAVAVPPNCWEVKYAQSSPFLFLDDVVDLFGYLGSQNSFLFQFLMNILIGCCSVYGVCSCSMTVGPELQGIWKNAISNRSCILMLFVRPWWEPQNNVCLRRSWLSRRETLREVVLLRKWFYSGCKTSNKRQVTRTRKIVKKTRFSLLH